MFSTKEVSYSRSPGHNGPSTTTPRLELSKLLSQADNATQGLDLRPRSPFLSYLPLCYPWPDAVLAPCPPLVTACNWSWAFRVG